nr:serine protease [Tatlockia sp.]
MRLSLKKLTFSLTLLIIGGGAGVFGSRYLPSPKQPFQQLRTVP